MSGWGGPFPHGRGVTYVLVTPAEAPRIFSKKEDALAAMTGNSDHVLEFVRVAFSTEYFVAYRHDQNGETLCMDMSNTDKAFVSEHFPDVSQHTTFGRYGNLETYTGSMVEFCSLWDLFKMMRRSQRPGFGTHTALCFRSSLARVGA